MERYLTFILLSLMAAVILGCPQDEDIAPCNCRYSTIHMGLDFTCRFIESEEQLYEIFDAYFPEKIFHSFTLEYSQLTSLRKMPENVTFEEINVSENYQLQYISHDLFLGSGETLVYFAASETLLNSTDFIFGHLDSFPVFESMIMVDTQVETIPAELKSDSLKEIFLQANIGAISAGK